MKRATKELFVKSLVFTLLIILMMVIIKFTDLNSIIRGYESRVGNISSHPLNGLEWLAIVGYRILIYFAIPIFVTIFEIIFFKNKRKMSWAIVNFEAHFIALSLVCGVYVIFGLDYLFGTRILTIEHSVTSILLFLFTFLLGKKFPHVFIPNEKETFTEEE